MAVTFKLPDDLTNYVQQQVSSGRFSSAGDVFRQALQLLERHEEIEAEKLLWLRDAWQLGLASGDPKPIDLPDFKAEARRRLAL